MPHPSPAFARGRAGWRAAAVFATLLAFAGPSVAQAPDYLGGRIYATVKGWTVKQSDTGCSAFQAAVPVIFNIPPAGGWQLIFPYNVPEEAGDFSGAVDIDKFSFGDSFFGDGTWIYADFPVEMRKTVGKGNRLYAEIGPMIFETDLTGATAALLKLEECWQRMTGWDAATSNRAGTFAFKGD